MVDEMIETIDEPISQEEAEKIWEDTYGATPTTVDKSNIHTFLHNVAIAKDTTKTGNITAEELGQHPITLRACKELALIASKIMNNEFFSEYFTAEGEIITSTSLSREGFLDKLAITSKSEISSVSEKPKKENSSWFKKKNPSSQSPVMES